MGVYAAISVTGGVVGLIAGGLLTTYAAGGMFWLSRIGEHSRYATGLLGPALVAGAGLGMLFMPLSLAALSRVQATAAGAASSLLNTGQQVGGSIGLALLGRVAWTAVANSIRSQSAAAAARAGRRARPPAGRCRPRSTGTRSPPGSPAGSRWRRDHAARPDHHHRRHPGTARRPGRRARTDQPGTAACVPPHRRCPKPSRRPPAVLEGSWRKVPEQPATRIGAGS